MKQRRDALTREFFEQLFAEKDFRQRAWRWLKPGPKVYSSVRVFVNGVELKEVPELRWSR